MKRLPLLLMGLLLAACAAQPSDPVPVSTAQPWSPPAIQETSLSPEAQNMQEVLAVCVAYAEQLTADFPETRVRLDAQDIACIEARLTAVDDDLRADLCSLVLNLRQQTFLQIEDLSKGGQASDSLEAALTAFEAQLAALGW